MLGLTGRAACDVTEHSIPSVLSFAFWNPPQNSSFPGKNRCVLGFHVYTNMALSPIFHAEKYHINLYEHKLVPSLLLKPRA